MCVYRTYYAPGRMKPTKSQYILFFFLLFLSLFSLETVVFVLLFCDAVFALLSHSVKSGKNHAIYYFAALVERVVCMRRFSESYFLNGADENSVHNEANHKRNE